MAGVWVAYLERYGYTLMVVERTKQKAMDSISNEYIKTYFKWNSEDGWIAEKSVEEMMENNEQFKEDYRCAMGDVNCNKMEYGKVEWT